MCATADGIAGLLRHARKIAGDIDPNDREQAINSMLAFVAASSESQDLEDYLAVIASDEVCEEGEVPDRIGRIEAGAVDLVYMAMETL